VLFAIGLSVYLWNIYIPVALPVVVTTSVAALVYILTAVLPLVFEYCPYTTASSKLIGSWFKGAHEYLRLRHNSTLSLRRATFSNYYSPWQRAKRRINGEWSWQERAREQASTWISTRVSYITQLFEIATSHFLLARSPEPPTAAPVPISLPFADPASLMENGEVPMDLVTSEMLAWLLTNCEDPKLTAVVIQSLAGAEPWLPRLPLLENDVLRNLYQCLDGCFELDSCSNTFSLKGLVSPDLAALYVRGLNFVLAYHNHEGFYCPGGDEDWSNGKLTVDRYSKLENTWRQPFETGLTALASGKYTGNHRYAFIALAL
jgi:hypothetical protein